MKDSARLYVELQDANAALSAAPDDVRAFPRAQIALAAYVASLPIPERLTFCGSYERMPFLMRYAYRSDFWELLGNEWAGCDNIWRHRRKFARLLRTRYPGWPIRDAMTAGDVAYWETLPRVVTVWRGCYRHNIAGFAWSTDRATAAGFPFLSRYWHPDKQPLLIEGKVARDRIAFVKVGRKEQEVITLPRFVTRRVVTQLEQVERNEET